jgi:hypothetical protein
MRVLIKEKGKKKNFLSKLNKQTRRVEFYAFTNMIVILNSFLKKIKIKFSKKKMNLPVSDRIISFSLNNFFGFKINYK